MWAALDGRWRAVILIVGMIAVVVVPEAVFEIDNIGPSCDIAAN